MRLTTTLAAVLVLGAALSTSVADGKKSTAQPTSADELFDALAALPGLDADYREEKLMAVLVDPVVSEGKVLFAPPSKLIRVTTKPIWSSLVVEENALSYQDAAGPQKIPAAKGDPARAFVEVFVDVARGNRKALEKTFFVKFSTDESGWTLGLNPKRKGLGITRIELSGKTIAIAKMTINDTNGDKTVMTFSNIKTGKRPTKKQIEKLLRKP